MDSTVEQIKQRLDIVEIMNEYIKLLPSTGNSMKACCPFHKEKTPSFYVSKDKQLWTCFGCGEGGDLFTFVMKMEGMDFAETVQYLAEKAGVEVQRYKSVDTNIKVRLSELINLSARFYNKVLEDSESAVKAREYLKARGVKDQESESFLLGYAPEAWDTLVTFLKKKGFHDQEMVDAGVAVKRQDGSGVFDRFRDRIMFPICDQRGKVVGFTGRLLKEAKDEGKYINTPQTLLYNKSQVLYGLHLAKTAIKDSGYIIIVEGNMDVIASHKAGVGSVVASSGTALTIEQLTLIKRFTNTILISFDADAAGQKAAKRGIDLAIEAGMDIRVITLPEGFKDPDDCVTKDPKIWKKAIAEATDAMTYYFKKVFGKGLPNTAVEKKQAGQTLLPEIARLQDPIERSHWIHELAIRVSMEDRILEEAIVKFKSGQKKTEVKKEKAEVEVELPQEEQNRHSRLAEALFELIAVRSDIRKIIFEKVTVELLPSGHYQPLYETAVSVYNEINEKDADYFSILRQKLAQNHPDTVGIFDRLSLKGEASYAQVSEEAVLADLQKIIEGLLELGKKQARLQITRQLAQAETEGDSLKIEELVKQFDELQ